MTNKSSVKISALIYIRFIKAGILLQEKSWKGWKVHPKRSISIQLLGRAYMENMDPWYCITLVHDGPPVGSLGKLSVSLLLLSFLFPNTFL